MDDYNTYVILTQPLLGHTAIAESCVKLGVHMLQLREKHMSDRDLIRLGRTLKSITKGSSTRLVINDRPDLALLCEADVLHLGQDDLPIAEARKIVGDLPIGLSTHSIEQARKALLEKPEYIGFGPIFPTNAKAKPDPPVGCEALKTVLSFSDRPVVAIGGIFPENIDEVVQAGARNVSVIRFLMQTTDFEARLRFLNQKIQHTNNT